MSMSFLSYLFLSLLSLMGFLCILSSTQELGKELEELALKNACTKRDIARRRRWQLERDLKAVEKRISRELNPGELIPRQLRFMRMRDQADTDASCFNLVAQRPAFGGAIG
jgi:hypothetical protein